MDDVEVLRLTITLTVTDDGDQVVGVESSDEDAALITLLGVLDLARDTVLQTNGLRDAPS